MENDFEFVQITCPRCGFGSDVMRRQIDLGERVICAGCHEDIELKGMKVNQIQKYRAIYPIFTKLNTIRCTVCYQGFSKEEVREATCCPKCGARARPHKIVDDVTLTLNWHELRLLAQCVDAFLMLNPSEKTQTVLDAILERLKAHQPEGALPLTLIDATKEALEERGAHILLEGGNVHVPGKFVWEIE